MGLQIPLSGLCLRDLLICSETVRGRPRRGRGAATYVVCCHHHRRGYCKPFGKKPDGGKRELRKQTRYRDGKVASTTGERFLVEPKESAEFVKATSVSIRVTGGGRTH